MINKLKQAIRRWLGITSIEQEVRELEVKVERIYRRRKPQRYDEIERARKNARKGPRPIYRRASNEG